MFMVSNWPIRGSTKIQFVPQSSPEISASHFMRSCNLLKRIKFLVLPHISFCASGRRLPLQGDGCHSKNFVLCLREMICSPTLKPMMVLSTRAMALSGRCCVACFCILQFILQCILHFRGMVFSWYGLRVCVSF